MEAHFLARRASSIIAAAAFVKNKNLSLLNVLVPRQFEINHACIGHGDDVVSDMLLPIWQLRPTHLTQYES